MKKLFPLLFLSLILYWSCEEEATEPEDVPCDDTLSNELKEFADENWHLQTWYFVNQIQKLLK